MRKITYDEYPKYAGCIPEGAFGGIYPRSIAEQAQSGDIFTDGNSILFWHLCGFGYIYGERSRAFLEEIYSRFLSPESETGRRFVLFTADEAEKEFFREKPGTGVSRRYFFDYPQGAAPQEKELPEGFELHAIDGELFDSCTGRITPLFSWEDKSSFLQRGKGFCVTESGKAAAWAFSAGITRDELDIGVETSEIYRKRGLAYIAASAVLRYALSQNKRPVWACSAENEGSRRLAEKLGYVKTAESYVIGKRG